MAGASGVRIEEILSGELEAPMSYRQDHDEWVVVLDGGAVLEVEGDRVDLAADEWILLGRGVDHRLMSTVPGTRWLVVRIPRALASWEPQASPAPARGARRAPTS